MGNRAIITTESGYASGGIGLYLHSNGGRDSVEAFCKYCALKGYRSPASDASYAFARMAQIIGNWFGGGLSVGVVYVAPGTDCGDNGIYMIGDGWRIVGRSYKDEEQANYDILEMLKSIDEAQPLKEQIGGDLLQLIIESENETFKEKMERIEIGSTVYIQDGYSQEWHKYTILGFGRHGRVCNGHDVSGLPIYDFTKYHEYSDYGEETEAEKLGRLSRNCNSYIFEGSAFAVPYGERQNPWF